MDPEYGRTYCAGYSSAYDMHPPTSAQLHEMQPPSHVGQFSPPSGSAAGAAEGGGAAPRVTAAEGARPGGASCESEAGGSTGYGSPYPSFGEYDEDTAEDARYPRTAEGKKQNHSEIEKRRRDKMNMYIMELSNMVPLCRVMGRRLDKLTVLRMAVQHLKIVCNTAQAFPEGRLKPPFLTELELKTLILQAADGFLFVADCDRGRMIYVSESVIKVLHYSQTELLGQSLFDILHPKDVAKVKEQLSSSDLYPRERLIDAKTLQPVRADVAGSASPLYPGARRSFFCRMKCKPVIAASGQHSFVKQEHNGQNPADRKYFVVRCTGYLKAVPRAEAEAAAKAAGAARPAHGDEEPPSTCCLVAVGRGVPELPRRVAGQPPMKRWQFASRHTPDGKFLSVDQRAALALGYLPQEMLGTSIYEYAAPTQVVLLARAHKAALVTRSPQSSAPCSLRRRDGGWAAMQTDWRPFYNPCTEELEWLVAHHTLLDLHAALPYHVEEPLCDPTVANEGDQEMPAAISLQLESHKIGANIMEEVLCTDSFSAAGPSSVPHEAVQDFSAYEHQMYESMETDEVSSLDPPLPHFSQVRNNVTLAAAAPPEEEVMLPLAEGDMSEGNDQAAMAVIMSLLEADAGLGGTVDFTQMKWPLP